MIIIDKHKSLSKKIRILAASLAKFPHEDQFVVPAVREAIETICRRRVVGGGTHTGLFYKSLHNITYQTL